MSPQNLKQQELLIALQASWLDFKEHTLQKGVDLLGSSLTAIRTIDAEIRKLSTGPESWAKGRQDNSENASPLTLS